MAFVVVVADRVGMATPNIVTMHPAVSVELAAAARRLDEEANGAGLDWWRTASAASMLDHEGRSREERALSAIAAVLGAGEDPMWVNPLHLSENEAAYPLPVAMVVADGRLTAAEAARRMAAS